MHRQQLLLQGLYDLQDGRIKIGDMLCALLAERV